MSTPARRLSAELLLRVERERSYLSSLLSTPPVERLSSRDQRLLTEISYGVLRWQKQLDWIIQRFARAEPDSLELPVRIILRMALYQLRFLTRVPPSAAVDEAVSLTRALRVSRAAGLVNGLLREYLRHPDVEKEWETFPDPLRRLALRTSHPEWLMGRWVKRWGEEAATALALRNDTPPPVAIRVNLKRIMPEAFIQKLEARRISYRRSAYLPEAIVLSSARIKHAAWFREGLFWFQDEASQMIPQLFQLKAGQRVLDACSAPGGKTFILAEGVKSTGWVLALDVHFSRVRVVQAQRERLGERNVLLAVADLRRGVPLRVPLDAVLVDAPCTGLGTLRRNPEIKWRVTEDDLRRLAALQGEILEEACRCVKPAGRLVYSTCTTEPEENEQVVRAFLSAHSEFRLAKPSVPESFRPFLCPDGFLRTHPSGRDLDGFFAAVLVRS